MSKVWSFSALSSTSGAPPTIRPRFSSVLVPNLSKQNRGQPAGVKEAREAGGGEGPVVLWDPKAAGLSPFSPAQNDFKIIPQHSSHDVLPANGHRFVMATTFSFALTCWYTTAGEGCHTEHRRLCSKHSQTGSSRTNRDSRCLPS